VFLDHSIPLHGGALDDLQSQLRDNQHLKHLPVLVQQGLSSPVKFPDAVLLSPQCTSESS
jgi:hypothetical protein